MKTFSKLKIFLVIFFIVIFTIIAARHFIGLHFKKKFSVRPAPGVIVEQVEKSLFYKSIETFGTAIAQNSKTYRIKKDNVVGNLKIENRGQSETLENLESICIKLINRWNTSDDKLDRKFDALTKDVNSVDNQISEVKGSLSRINGRH